jgi:uncharacterized membrane protein
LEDIIKQATLYLAAAIEASAGIIIGLAAIEATYRAVGLYFFFRQSPEESKETIRLRLGRWLALALEFELAADILRTAIAPTWSEVGLLAAIVVLRTVLNFFLQMEIEKAAQNKNEINSAPALKSGRAVFTSNEKETML